MPYTREPLSGSSHGRGILLTGTATGSSVTIHTGQASTTLSDIVSLQANNFDQAGSHLVTIEWGGTTSPNDLITMWVPPKSLVIVVTDLLIRNSLVVKGWADTANLVTILGFVNTEA